MKYLDKELGQNIPHIFAIADLCYQNLLSQAQSQSIIISGESGAGKTDSTNFILQYLTWRASNKGRDSWVEQQILEANKVLESFGNFLSLSFYHADRGR